jgi:sigma-B regulation protein RsbU (phosphoserine phosphatase)
MQDIPSDKGFLLLSLMEHMTDNIYFKDVDSRFVMVNQAFCNWMGRTTEEVIGKTDFDLFAERHAREAFEDEQRIIQTGEPLLGIEEKETWPDGRITWVSTSKMPLRSEEGEILGTFGISRDITDHKEAELKAAYYAEEVRRRKEAMENDVRMAAELQHTFFPSSYPVFPEGADPAESRVGFLHHYHASGLVSGDFCTIQRLSDAEAGIFLCDVMGHGVRASLGTALVCALVNELSHVENDPGTFLERMNELLLPVLRQQDAFLYATACYMIYNADTGQLRYANAGHPIPLRFSETGVEWLMEDSAQRGPALAIVEGSLYETCETRLVPGDTVVSYTDGLYEVERADGQEFGEERLLKAAHQHAGKALSELFPALINEARHFAGSGEFDDDVCLVGFRCNAVAGEDV